jgi:hypothetical protein
MLGCVSDELGAPDTADFGPLPAPEPDVHKILDEHPGFAATLGKFMALRDAAEVLAELKPPYYETAAAYLTEIADHVMRDAGLGEDFLQAMIATRPPLASR